MAFILVSCAPSSMDETLEEEKALSGPLLDQLDDCSYEGYNIGDEIYFPMYDGTIGSDYDAPTGFSLVNHAVLVPQIAFTVGDDCLCAVREYILEYENFPGTGDYVVEDANGNSLPYTAVVKDPADPNSNTVVTIDLFGVGTDVVLSALDDLDPKPTLVLAGGLCVVENVSNPPPGVEFADLTYPYEVTVPPHNGNPGRQQYYIPTQGIWSAEVAKLYNQINKGRGGSGGGNK